MSEVAFEEMPSTQAVLKSAAAGERTVLEAFLDFYRDALVRKVSGLSEDDARRQLVGSSTTLAGLIKHLRIIEMNWFQRILEQTPEDDLPITVAWQDPDSTFRVEASETISDLVAAYRQQCEISRQVASARQLSSTVPNAELGNVSLRWIYVHMIDETARHVGHADILREQTDGQTGP